MFLERLRLDGKAALVAGGADGIGAAVTLALAEAGADVAVLDSRTPELEQTAQRVHGLGRRAVSIQADVTDDRQLEAGTAHAIEALGRVDVLANVAGGATGVAPWAGMLDYPLDAWDRLHRLNLRYVFILGRLVARRMIEAKRGGSIINVISQAAERPPPGLVGYSTAKAGLAHLTKAMALEWAPHGIRANGVAPGGVSSPRVLRLRRITRDQYDAQVGKSVPLGRGAYPEDVAGAVLFLASDLAAHVTGHIIPVDGGSGIGGARSAVGPPGS